MAKSLKDYVDAALAVVPEIEVSDVQNQDGWLILDVREPDEYAAGHIPGSINIPRGFLEVKADLEHPKRDARLASRDQRIVCICGGGHRSALAGKVLLEMGFAAATSVRGGWTAWTEAGLPVELEEAK